MINITLEKTTNSQIEIAPMSIKREWMDSTPEKHAYRCFPVTQANMIGWNLYSNKDIRFIWNGISDTSAHNVQIIEGKEFTYTGRGQATISFMTGIIFRTDENISLLTINPVNFFNENFETVSSLISTSFYDNDYPLAIKSKVANKEVVIKAGEPLATIIPISLTDLDNTCIQINEYSDPGNIRNTKRHSYGEASQQINSSGKWTDWYRDAVNEKGESIGRHEAKVLRLSVKDNRSSKI